MSYCELEVDLNIDGAKDEDEILEAQTELVRDLKPSVSTASVGPTENGFGMTISLDYRGTGFCIYEALQKKGILEFVNFKKSCTKDPSRTTQTKSA